MLAAFQRNEVDVLIVFSTNRLYRKHYRAIQFVEEEIIAQRKRAVFVSQNIDSARTEHWRLLLTMISASDELQSQSIGPHVRAAHQGLTARRLVTTTQTFGYRGVPVDTGEQSKRGRPRMQIEIDEESAAWVRQIFQWFGTDRLSIAEIKRRLRHSPSVPPPPKSKLGIWSHLAIHIMLSNRRYTGDFSYGLKEAVFLPKQGYIKQVRRDQPLSSHHFPELCIIDGDLFETVQARLACYRERIGNRKRRNGELTPSSILRGILICSKHASALSSNGRAFFCPRCKEFPVDAALYSLLPEKLATRVLMAELAKEIRSSETRVQLIRERVRAIAIAVQTADPDQIVLKRKRVAELTDLIQQVALLPAATQEDRQENNGLVTKLRAERAKFQSELKATENTSRVVHVPTDSEISAQLVALAELLIRAAAGKLDADAHTRARRIVVALTGGRIVLHQAGEAKPKRGWLRGTFALNVVEPILLEAQIRGVSECVPTSEVVVEFRSPDALAELSEKVKAQADKGMLLCDIATTEKVAKSRVTKAMRYYYAIRGLPFPDGRSRRATLSKKHRVAPRYQQIAERVQELVANGELLGAIAKLLDVDRNTVTQAIQWWHHAHGVPIPPGRGRRRNHEPTGQADGEATAA
jgi:DNA invertase Pin-like site-specific DNA recombinase